MKPIHNIVPVLDTTFEKIVLQSSLPVLVDFWASWCKPCQILAPLLEKIAQKYNGKLLVVKAHVDDVPDWADYFNIRHIPTMLFIANGRLLHRVIGFRGERFLEKNIQDFIQYQDTPSLKVYMQKSFQTIKHKFSPKNLRNGE